MGPAGAMTTREYPDLTVEQRPQRPLSLVCVRFSGDFEHNFAVSESVADPINEVVVVDNRGNLFFENLSAAIEAGIERSTCDLIAIVHEDVLLPRGWQATLEASLEELERHDPDWAVAGAGGWTDRGRLIAHLSDPRGYHRTLGDRAFRRIARIDEQLILMRREGRLRFDTDLPSIHNIGHDLANQAAQQGRRSYVVNAPTIHKYADEEGKPILSRRDSPKIVDRRTLAHRADRACSDEYVLHKWPGDPIVGGRHHGLTEIPVEPCDEEPPGLDSPIVLLAKGGGGSRVLSGLASDLGLFVGNEVSEAGDAMELVLPIYKIVLTRYRRHAPWQMEARRGELRAAACRMLIDGGAPALWGFKLPESLLVLDEIASIFPNARFLHMIRDPLATCLRRTHMTARLDNQIGRVTLPAAYRWCGRPVEQVLDDPPALHMAFTTMHQLTLALEQQDGMSDARFGTFRFEDLFDDHAAVAAGVLSWLGPAAGGFDETHFVTRLDPSRAAARAADVEEPVVREVESLLDGLRRRLGYVG